MMCICLNEIFVIFYFYQELRKIAFEIETNGNNDGINRKQQLGAFSKDFKKLGFKYDTNPSLDFSETPPGMLALDCMYYFAKNRVEAYTKVKCIKFIFSFFNLIFNYEYNFYS